MQLTRITYQGTTYAARLESDAAVLIERERDALHSDALITALDRQSDLAQDAIGAVPLDSVEILAPLRFPSKIVAVGANYYDHAREAGFDPPGQPLLFAKWSNALLAPGNPIRVPRAAGSVDYEVELAVVIGRTARQVDERLALDHVLGYTVCNDVSARDIQQQDGQWTRWKSLDTFAPLGPWIVTADEIPDPQALQLWTEIGGRRLQDGNTGDMIFSVAEIIVHTSRHITLYPGDLLITGTPAGVGYSHDPPVYLVDGIEVTTGIEKIGVLRNPVEGC